MKLTEESVFDLITWRSDTGNIEVRRSDIIYKGGVEVTRTYHRHVVGPSDNLSKEHEHVQRIANAFKKERAAKGQTKKDSDGSNPPIGKHEDRSIN